MSVHTSYVVDNRKWEVAYLISDTRFTPKERFELVMEAIDMYVNNKQKRKVSGRRYGGIIENTGKDEVLGSFYGRHFEADVFATFGKTKLAFLVAKRVPIECN